MMYSSPILVRLRSLTRRLGLNRIASSLIAARHYEDRFGPALQEEVHEGDTVWDIGANLGLYTQEFLSALGLGKCGQVVAFEPTPACFASLRERFSSDPRVRLMNVAVGESDGTLNMFLEDDPLAPTHRIVAADGGDLQTLAVAVRSAASIVREEPELFPSLVKIDVEGHEGAVLDGMLTLMPDKRLRCIGIEVHFGLLEGRGEAHRPEQMEHVLMQHGFRVRWTDPSHLLAVR